MALQSTPSIKSAGGWITAVIMVTVVIFLMANISWGRSLLNGQIPTFTPAAGV